MEAFQGQYKDGTNGTWDFRIVSALYLIVRIALTSEKEVPTSIQHTLPEQTLSS